MNKLLYIIILLFIFVSCWKQEVSVSNNSVSSGWEISEIQWDLQGLVWNDTSTSESSGDFSEIN